MYIGSLSLVKTYANAKSCYDKFEKILCVYLIDCSGEAK